MNAPEDQGVIKTRRPVPRSAAKCCTGGEEAPKADSDARVAQGDHSIDSVLSSRPPLLSGLPLPSVSLFSLSGSRYLQ